MIDVLEACELVTKGTDTPFVSGITDIGDKFIIATLTKDGVPIDSAKFIDKNTKEITGGNFLEFKKYLSKFKKIDVPEKFLYKKFNK